MHRGRLVAVLLALVLALPCTAQEPGRPTLTFGSLLDPSASGGTEWLLEKIEDELGELLGRDYDLRFPESEQRLSDWTAAVCDGSQNRSGGVLPEMLDFELACPTNHSFGV